MASGIYNKLNITSANTDTVLVASNAVASGKVAVITLNIVNTNEITTANIYVAISSTTTPALGDYLEYSTALGGYGTLERTGIVLPSGYNLIVKSSATGVGAIAYGFEG